MSKRRPSMRNVADAANVSVSAVSLVVRGKPGVAPETRKRVWDTIARLGYAVAAPENGRPTAVALLIERSSMPVILDIFYGDVIHGFQAEAQRLDYRVHLHMFDKRAESLDTLRSTLAGEVQGLVVANDGDITPEMVIQLEALQLPLVLIESYLPGQQLPCVLGDNFTAGYTAMEHLIERGHRSIAVLRGPRKYSSLMDRLKGCLAAAAEAGILIPPEYMPHPMSGHPKKGYVQMQEILSLPQRPTAIVAISDKTAFGAMEAIKEAGLRIPEDIAITSIDNVAESAYTRPPLTSFHMPRTAMGQLAMQKLHRLISGEPEVPVKSIIYGELVVRESSGASLEPLSMIEPRTAQQITSVQDAVQ
jgi:DNA-binding LacI/PurR family transcriptional regulator